MRVAKDGSSVRLSDIGRVEDGHEELRTRIRVDGEPAVAFDVVKQSGTNTIAVNDAVRAKLAKIEKTFPQGMHANMIIVTMVVRRSSGANSPAMLGRLSVPADFLAAHFGDSGRNGRITISGIAGIKPDISV